MLGTIFNVICKIILALLLGCGCVAIGIFLGMVVGLSALAFIEFVEKRSRKK